MYAVDKTSVLVTTSSNLFIHLGVTVLVLDKFLEDFL